MQRINFDKILQAMEGWQEEGDYYTEANILMCGKCHTPKMEIVNVPGLFKERPSPRPCKCMQEHREREESEYRRRTVLERMCNAL